MRNVSNKIVDKIKTHILCSITFFLKHAFYDIMCKKLQCLAGDRLCWMPKAADTPRICNTYCFSTAKMVAQRTRLDVTLYVCCLSCLSFIKYFNPYPANVENMVSS